MTHSEQPISEDMIESIQACADDARSVVGAEADDLTPEALVAGVDELVYRAQKNKCKDIDDTWDFSVALGSLWGECLVKQLGWAWAEVTFHGEDDQTAIGVVSPDRSLAIYPFYFVYGCLENNAPVTILLSFNLLVDGSRVPNLPANGYENVMENVHHIVPRD